MNVKVNTENYETLIIVLVCFFRPSSPVTRTKLRDTHSGISYFFCSLEGLEVKNKQYISKHKES